MKETLANTDTLLELIKSGKPGRDKALYRLYKDDILRGKVKATVTKYGARKDDHDMLFNTALMQFVKTVIKNKSLEIKGTIHSYICGIAKYCWLNEVKKNHNRETADIDDQYDLATDHTPESLLIDSSKKEHINLILEKLGKNCKEVLLYWANGYSMKEIADMMDYKSDMMAKKKKYKCFKELLDFLEARPDLKNVLK